jgi:antitoxin MazE
MENANKTRVRFGWCVNGGFLEGRSSAYFPLRLIASKLEWIYNGPGISSMQVSKWGNSLAVRLPAVIVEALDLKEGDEIEISIASKRDFKVARDRSKRGRLSSSVK